MRISRSFLIALGLLGLLHVYIGLRLLPALPIGVAGRVVGVLLLAASCALIPLGLMARSMSQRSPATERLVLTALVAMGQFSSLFVFTLLRDVVMPIAALFTPAMATDYAREISAVIVIGMALFATLVGYINARRVASVVNVDVPIADLPAGLQGFSIAQISDIHVGPTIRREYVEGIVAAVNELRSRRDCDHRRPGRWQRERARVARRTAGATASQVRRLLCHRQSRVLLRRTRLDQRAAAVGGARADERARGVGRSETGARRRHGL